METRLVEVKLESFAYGGSAIGHLADGKAAFIPYGLPGEKVLVEIVEDGKSYCRGRIEKVLVPSVKRIEPLCPHFGVCGGCHYQNLDYPDQLELKKLVLIDQLRRIGRIETPPVADIIPSPAPWNYRNTVQFHVTGSGKLGFQRSQTNKVIQISECHLPVDQINQIWPQLEIDPSAGIDRVQIRCGSNSDLLVGLESRQDLPPEFEIDFPLSVVFLGAGEDLLLSGEPDSVMTVKGVEFLVSARSFFQVNLSQAEAMVNHVLTSVKLSSGSTVFDLYCGVGLFSRFIAPLVKTLVGVELSETACNDFASNLEPFNNVSLYVGAVEDVLPGLEAHPDVVLVDPPRAGLAPRALDNLIKLKPEQIIYVSCDPTTLGRDARRLIDNQYVLKSVQPFDLFPQTFHIESITLFEKQENAH